MKYISFVYDNPHVNIFSYTVSYPTNYVFLFDSDLCNTFNKGGIKNVYYSPLAADIFTPKQLEPESVWTVDIAKTGENSRRITIEKKGERQC